MSAPLFDRLLQLRRGLPPPPEMLAPFTINPRDVVDLQRAAGRLARHVGLGDLTFIVAVTQQPPDVAGHIEIKYAQREVFIEISDQILTFPRAVLATLAHEVTHKYLHTHGIWLADLLENERLTDTAAVFNGLGLLMLNGCEDEVRRQVGETQYVHQFKGGYLDRDTLAQVYAAVHLGRGAAVPRAGLTEPAAAAVKPAEKTIAKLLKGRETPDALADRLESRVRDEQRLLAGAQRDLALLMEQGLPALQQQIKARHAALRLNQDALQRLRDGEDDALARGRARAWIKATDQRCEGETRALRNGVGGALAAVESLVEIDATPSRVLICGACDGKLRLPAAKSVVARCPRCDYRFSADTTADGPQDPKRKGWRRILG